MKRTSLIEARRKAGLSAAVLAEVAGTDEMRVFAFERGRYKPHPDEADRIARVLGQPVETLFPDLKGGTQ